MAWISDQKISTGYPAVLPDFRLFNEIFGKRTRYPVSGQKLKIRPIPNMYVFLWLHYAKMRPRDLIVSDDFHWVVYL